MSHKKGLKLNHLMANLRLPYGDESEEKLYILMHICGIIKKLY